MASIKVGTLNMCRVINGLWQTSGGWGKIDTDKAVQHMIVCAQNGFSSFDGADHYGPAEDLMGMLLKVLLKMLVVVCFD